MVMAVEKVSETVSLGTRPGYQQISVYSQLEVKGQRRHKQEIKLVTSLQPVRYADTAFLLLNNSRKRFRSRTYYEPRVNQKSFADTTYATPPTTQERFVSCLDCYSDQIKRKFKTCIEINPKKNFKSSVCYPNMASLPTASTSARLANGFYNSDGELNDVDENMNCRIPPPVFKERFDPGASQVFIPQRKELNFSSSQDGLFDGIRDQILVDFSQNSDNKNNNNANDLCNGYATLNGHVSDFSDL